ncbi:MAG: NB-ARC domain-containing protein [Chloroflexales bacterium]
MNREERIHIERLLDIHRASLRELEVQAATFGDLYVPPHVAHQLAEHRGKIAEMEAQLSTMSPLHNLPPRDYEQFIGRQSELAELRRLLLPRSRAFVITIDGIGGIGKSALALEAAYTWCDSYVTIPEAERFEAIVWVSAKRSYLTADGILERRQAFRTLDDLYAAISQVLDYPAITRARTEEQRAIVEQVLGEQRTLLILDNLETVDDEELMAFLRELPPPAKALVTTRHRIDVAYPVRLTGMPQPDALALIDQEAARKATTLSPDDREQLWLRTGGMPLAIVWSIGLMGLGGSVESVLRRLGSGQSDIAQFCFAESAAQIHGRDAYWLLLALSLFTPDASRKALGMVAGLGEDLFGCDGGLGDLLRLSLVNKSGDRFSLLPLTRSFVQSEVKIHDAWIRDARERWVAYYDDFIDHKSGWSDDWSGHDQVELEIINIFAVFDYLVATLDYEGTSDRDRVVAERSIPHAIMLLHIADRVSRTLRIRGYWRDCERLAQIALPISKATGHQRTTGWLSYTMARIHYYNHSNIETTRIWILDMLSVAQKQGDRAMSSRANLLLGLIELQQNNIEQARPLFNVALEETQLTNSTRGISNILAAMGDLALASGDISTATSHYQQAIDRARQVNDLPKLASHLLHLGIASRTIGELAMAKQELEESLRLARECGWVSVIASALYHLALVDRDQHGMEEARSHVNQALDLFRRLGMRKEQAEAEALLTQMGATP